MMVNVLGCSNANYSLDNSSLEMLARSPPYGSFGVAPEYRLAEVDALGCFIMWPMTFTCGSMAFPSEGPWTPPAC